MNNYCKIDLVNVCLFMVLIQHFSDFLFLTKWKIVNVNNKKTNFQIIEKAEKCFQDIKYERLHCGLKL